MSGIYIHIPFCKQACHYCDFHFSTSMKKKEEMVLALVKEMELRKDEFQNEEVETIYFGGGTPSVLSIDDIRFLIDTVYKQYKVVEHPEISLEANPDDLNTEIIIQYANSPINRLSIGVQSFFDDDLQLMNRAHNSEEAKKCLKIANFWPVSGNLNPRPVNVYKGFDYYRESAYATSISHCDSGYFVSTH